MKSEWTKRQDAERIAASQFKEGTDVALVNTHWHRRIDGKRKVLKVYKNGNFLITTVHGTEGVQQWRPDQSGTRARKAGKQLGFRDSQHLEPWSPAIEAEIAERKLIRKMESRRDAIIEALKNIKGEALTVAPIDEIERALGLEPFPSAADEQEQAREDSANPIHHE